MNLLESPKMTVWLLGLQCLAASLVGSLVLYLQRYDHGVTASLAADVAYYYEVYLKILDGQFPYKNFTFEYPSLALFPILLSSLLNFFKPHHYK